MSPDRRPVGRGRALLLALTAACGGLVPAACAETGPPDGGTGPTASEPARPVREDRAVVPPPAPAVATPAGGSRVKVSVVRQGRDATPEAAAWPDLADAAVAVLRSCTSRSKRRIGPPDWDDVMAAESRVHVDLAGPQRIEIAGAASVTVTAILVPAGPSPAVLARNGATFYSPFTACDGAPLASVLTR